MQDELERKSMDLEEALETIEELKLSLSKEKSTLERGECSKNDFSCKQWSIQFYINVIP